MSQVLSYPSYFNSSLIPRLFILVWACDYLNSFLTLPSSLPPSLTRGRTFDEIREESRRQQLQKNFPRVGREREEVYVEKGDWRQREQGRMWRICIGF